MEPLSIASFLLTGLATLAAGLAVMRNPGLLDAFYAWTGTPPADMEEKKKTVVALVLSGVSWIFVVFANTFPFAHAKPFWVVTLAALLLPLAVLLTGGILLWSLLLRRRMR